MLHKLFCSGVLLKLLAAVMVGIVVMKCGGCGGVPVNFLVSLAGMQHVIVHHHFETALL